MPLCQQNERYFWQISSRNSSDFHILKISKVKSNLKIILKKFRYSKKFLVSNTILKTTKMSFNLFLFLTFLFTIFFVIQPSNFNFMSSPVRFDKAQPSYSLYQLALDFEKNPRKLEEAPQEFIDYFTLPALSISLKATYPQLPYFDEEKVENIMKDRDFSSIDALANFIKSQFKRDIEQYRAIYTWVCHKILFDADAMILEKPSYSTAEDIFRHRITCANYVLVLDLVSKVGITFTFTKINCYGKGYGFQPNTPKLSPEKDDSILIVEINKHLFMSDPGWGCGYIGKDKKFHQRYNPSLCLIPYVKGLNQHFPISTKLPVFVRYSKFLQINNFASYPNNLMLESHPYQKYYCDSGYMHFYFSCDKKITEISAGLTFYDDSGNQISLDDDATVKIISEDKCKRFMVKAAFQRVGKYALSVFLDSQHGVKYFINSTKALEVVPFLKPHFGKDVVPIFPTVRTSKVDTNYAIIKLQCATENADLLIDVDKDGKTLPRKYTDAGFIVPGRPDLREMWACVPFPGPGTYFVKLYLYNGTNYTQSITYEYEVSYKHVVENPFIQQFLDEKKDFQPVLNNPLQITPNESTRILKPGSFSVTAIIKKGAKHSYNLNTVPSNDTIFPDSETISSYDGTHNQIKSTFEVTKPGLYKLLAFVDHSNVFEQFYYITNQIPYESNSLIPQSHFLSSISNEPVIVERPFVFPDDPNENIQEEEPTCSKTFSPGNLSVIEEASAGSLTFLQKAANTNSEFLKNAESANSEFLKNASNNSSLIEDAMTLSASFLQQAGALNSLFYRQATTMISEFLKVVEAISNGENQPPLSSNPAFNNTDIFVPPRVDIDPKYKVSKPAPSDAKTTAKMKDELRGIKSDINNIKEKEFKTILARLDAAEKKIDQALTHKGDDSINGAQMQAIKDEVNNLKEKSVNPIHDRLAVVERKLDQALDMMTQNSKANDEIRLLKEEIDRLKAGEFSIPEPPKEESVKIVEEPKPSEPKEQRVKIVEESKPVEPKEEVVHDEKSEIDPSSRPTILKDITSTSTDSSLRNLKILDRGAPPHKPPTAKPSAAVHTPPKFASIFPVKPKTVITTTSSKTDSSTTTTTTTSTSSSSKVDSSKTAPPVSTSTSPKPAASKSTPTATSTAPIKPTASMPSTKDAPKDAAPKPSTASTAAPAARKTSSAFAALINRYNAPT